MRSPASPPSPSRHRAASAPAPRSADGPAATADRALVLQGGGALGAYQAGVYEALAETSARLDWVAGVSIGAINAALIVGNAPGQRVARLREFWNLVSSGWGQQIPATSFGDRSLLNQLSATTAVMFGIPGFFQPRSEASLALLSGNVPVTSFYDTSPLKSTLERLIDFDRINHRQTRLSVGAVNVRTGNSVYFDNLQHTIRAEHIMASGALPPGFPAVHIDGEDYWDGGVVSNTPLQYVLDMHPRSRPLQVLQVDLFSARGAMPQTMSEVAQRQKDIMYSSRTRLNTDTLSANVNLQQAMAELMSKLPEQLRGDPSVSALCAQLRHEPIEIVHLIYRHRPYELDSKDYEFSRATVLDHWEAGLRDLRHTLSHPEWLERETRHGVTTFDLSEGGSNVVRRPVPDLTPDSAAGPGKR